MQVQRRAPHQEECQDASQGPGEILKNSYFIKRVVEKVLTISGWDLQ